jgi:hypothetical protein
MKLAALLALAVAVTLTACHTAAPEALATMDAPASQVGRPIEDVLNQLPDRRVEFYDAAGNKLTSLPQGTGGSVSVFLPEGQVGQDNYALDEGGVIVRHQRSHGESYHQGTWVDVAPR